MKSDRRTVAKFGFIVLVLAVVAIIGGEILLMHPTGQQEPLAANVTSSNITITSASLSSSSLSLTIQNTGNVSSSLREVTVTPLQESNTSALFYINSSGDIQPFSRMGNESFVRFNDNGTVVQFANGTVVFNNGTIGQFNGTLPGDLINGSTGYYNGSIGYYNGTLPPFNGTIPPFNGTFMNDTSATMNFGYSLSIGSSVAISYNGQISSIIPGEQYTITVIGDNSVAETVVTAN